MSKISSTILVNSKEEVWGEALDFVSINSDRRENPSGDYHGNLTIKEDIIYGSFDDALFAVRELTQNKDYVDFAVPFKDMSDIEVVETKGMQTLKERLKRNREDRQDYDKKSWVGYHKAKLIACRNCDSKINTDFLKKHINLCPVCHADLRAEYIQERLKKYDDDFDDLNKRYKNDYQKQKDKAIKKTDKAPIRWLLSVSVHC